MTFASIQDLIDLALREDLGYGDVTTKALIPEDHYGRARVEAREDFVLAGLEVFALVFHRLEPTIALTTFAKDGAPVHAGDTIARLEGPLWALLGGERTALNFLQRLSGVATLTRHVVQRVQAYPVKILDTRKTTPGWRVIEKEAVVAGGAHNHRTGLFDGVLIKDNHLRAAGGVARAVARARARAPFTLKIEVEVTTLAEVQEALDAKADIIMLDNMSLEEMRRAVEVIRGRALTEASGGVTLDNVEAVAQTGVDCISMGALTSAFRAVDISMEVEE